MKQQHPDKKTTVVSPAKIHIRDITTIKKVFEKTFVVDKSEDFENGLTEITADHSIGIIRDNNLIRLELKISLNGNRLENRPLAFKCNYVFGFLFEIENLNDFQTNEDDKVSFDINLGTTLLSIAYSTCRGIIYSDTSTLLNKGVITPVINPKEFLVKKELSKKADTENL